MSSAAAPGRFWRSRWWRVGRFVLGLGLGALAFFALNGQRNELAGASSELTHVRVGWLLLAVACELASFVSFGLLQRRLLRCGEVRVGAPFMTALSLAAGAISNSVPAGPALASVYAYRQYRRRGANEAVAAWTLLATLLCAALALGLLATAGALVASRESASYDLVGVIFGVLAITAVADAVVWQRRWLAHVAVAVLLWSRRLTGHPRRHGLEIVEEFLARMTAVRLGWRDLLVTLAAGFGDWVFDCGALVCSFLALGDGVPWRGLLLAYGAGQLAANLPITPGGLGVVEGSLTIALVAFGGAELSTVAAVLLYRIVSFWGYLPVGWLTWCGITLANRRADRLELAAAAPARAAPPDILAAAVHAAGRWPPGPADLRGGPLAAPEGDGGGLEHGCRDVGRAVAPGSPAPGRGGRRW